MSELNKQALLRKVAELVGNARLAKHLNVPETTLSLWLRGLATMPDRKLLPLADLLDKLGRTEENK